MLWQYGTDDGIKVGTPLVEGAKVTAEVVKNGKAKKSEFALTSLRRAKREQTGGTVRQPYTQVKITSIEA